MPIDNATLLRHTPPPPKHRPRPWWVAPLVLLLGAAGLISASLLALGDPFRTRMVVIALVALGGAFCLWRCIVGWQEGGMLGALYRHDHPMGTMLAGDEERDGLTISLWILASLALLLAVALTVAAPSAFATPAAAPPPAAASPGER